MQWKGVDEIDLAQRGTTGRLVKMVKILQTA